MSEPDDRQQFNVLLDPSELIAPLEEQWQRAEAMLVEQGGHRVSEWTVREHPSFIVGDEGHTVLVASCWATREEAG